MTDTFSIESIRRLLDDVVDPEIPVLTIADLGILRGVKIDDHGSVVVTITPTYSGCPAMSTIVEDIESTLANAGVERVTVRTVFQPAWTTDWMTETAKEKLKNFGIAPPTETGGESPSVLCPQCASGRTKTISVFGSTACKALMVCSSCLEPFDYFKAI